MQFAPRRSVRSNHIVIAFVLAFSIFVTVMILFVGKNFGISMMIISALLLLMIVMETSKLGWRYWVDEEGIGIKRTFKRYHISADDVESVKAIGWHQAERILKSAQTGGTRMQSQVDFGRVIGFSSIPIPVPGSRSAPGKEIRNSKISGAEIFISLKKKNGRYYLLTPNDTKGFVKVCKSFGIGKNSKNS